MASGKPLYSTGNSARCSVETWRWDGRENREGGEMCIHIADSLHYTAETNTTS